MKKLSFWLTLLALLVSVPLLSACGAKGAFDMYETATPMTPPIDEVYDGYGNADPGGYPKQMLSLMKSDSEYSYSYARGGDMSDIELQMVSGEVGAGSASQSPELAAPEKKIIRNGDVFGTAEDAPSAYQSIIGWVRANGGYEFNKDQQQNSAGVRISAQLKIPPAKLDALLEVIKDTIEVSRVTTSGQDITDQYYDTDTRLTSMRKSLDQYYLIMEKAEKIEDILRVQNEINNLTTSMEALEGRLQLWDRQVSEASINLEISDNNREITGRSAAITPMAQVWNDSWSALSSFLRGLARIGVALVPWLVIIVPIILLIWLLFWISKRRLNKNRDKGVGSGD
ncbi:MAG: DUF4349 domain-containing protein [Clostridiales bacterium]|nr:DUF4349 domain-containing protein [Clostridiales bacterium]